MKVNVIKSNLKYPLYSCKFINDDLLLVTGGGGEGNNGIDNKVTLLTILDNENKIKKFRELKLSDDDDSPTCMDYIDLPPHMASNNSSFDLGADGIKVDGIFLLGCNENSNKIMQTNTNNSLQRFNYENQHIRFVASVDYDKEMESQRDLNTYMKFLKISENIEFAAVCTNKFPSIIRIINPITLHELYEIETGNELKDFDFQQGKDAKILSYITKNTCELISCVTGTFITKSYQFDVDKFTTLKLKFITNDKFFILLKNEVSNKFELQLFSITGEIKHLKTLQLNELKFKGITSVDFANNILAISGNDNSVSFFYLNHTGNNASLKFLKKFDELHTFAITKIAFNKSGSRLATVSADNSVSVINIPQNFEKFKPTTKRLLTFIINSIIIAILAVLGKMAVDRDYHIIAQKHLIEFNDNKFQPFLNEKAIPYLKQKISKKNNDDVEYFKFKSAAEGDEYTQVTVLSREPTTERSYYYSSVSEKIAASTSSAVPTGNYYNQQEQDNVKFEEDDDDVPINYEDYLASLTLDDIVSVTTPGYETKITDVNIQTVPNVEEDVEEILKSNYPTTTTSVTSITTIEETVSAQEDSVVSIQTAANVEEDVEEILKATYLSTTTSVTATDTIEEIAPVQEESAESEEADPIVEAKEEEIPVEEIVSSVVEAEEIDVVKESNPVQEEPLAEKESNPVQEETLAEKESNPVQEETLAKKESNPIQEETPAEEKVAPVVEEEDEEDATVQEETSVEEEVPVIEKEIEAAEEVVPVIEEEIEAVEKEAPLNEEDTPVLEKEAPLTEEEVPSVEEDTPIVEEDTPIVEEDTPTVEEERIAIEKAPLAEESQIIKEEVPVVEEQEIVTEKTENQLFDREDVKSTPVVETEVSEEKTEPIEKILAEDIESKLPDHVDVPMHTKNTVEETTKTIQITEFEESNSEPVEIPTSETQAVYDKPTQFDEEKHEYDVPESLDEQLEELFQENEVIEENIALDEL
ncbi:hypothetical protein ACO0SA_003548 [Hanseniaspora valbyensis]